MRVRVDGFASRSFSKMIVIFAAIFLLPPVTPSVLCVAPGSHIAIEELSAGCCAPSSVSTHGHKSLEDALSTADECQDCTDYLISSIVGGPIFESSMSAQRAVAAECFSPQPMALTGPRFLSETAPLDIGAPSLHTSAIPLRC
jgi:hypothetical protein